MSVIPIDPKEVIIHTDDDGNEFHFRYLIGEHRTKFNKSRALLADAAAPFIKVAEKQLIKRNKKPDPAEVSTRSILLAKEAGKITEDMEDRQTADIIDVFLVNWKGKNKQFPKIGNGSKPSDFLNSMQLVEIMEMLGNYIEKLIGLSVEDQKN